MKIKKLVVTTVIGTMMLGGFTASPIGFPSAKVQAAAPAYVAPEKVDIGWVVGDLVDSAGNRFENARKSIYFSPPKAEKGTLIIDIKKKEFRWMENYRHPSTMESLPFHLHDEPYLTDGRGDDAKRAYTRKDTDFLNRESAENFTIRETFFIDSNQVEKDRKYYLGGPGTTSESSFYYEAYFYPGVDLTPMSKAERIKYVERTKNGKEIPTSNVSHIGRVLIKSKDMFLYNKDGKAHGKLKQYEGLRVYEVQDDRYQVGGGYYVKKTKDTLFYVGHVYSEGKNMDVYDANGGLFKKFKPRENVRVYSTENGRYQVGAGYYVSPDFHISFDR
ncbi:hypothetical protein [Metabacillus fastidiosus]|uniref:hypothetical protein n=1 Tax=Metabacillus fastidiosus TaxID=1458 RepID=UPI003D26BB6B